MQSSTSVSDIIGMTGAAASLKAITTYSLFHSEAELFDQFEKHVMKTGTHIVIYNLRHTSSGHLEFDLQTDIHDIMIPDDVHNTLKKGKYKRQDREDWHPAMDYSLRVYSGQLISETSLVTLCTLCYDNRHTAVYCT
jgi:hypothetical protein